MNRPVQCLLWQDCLDGEECPRALTPEVLDAMQGDGELMAEVFVEEPWCFDPKMGTEVPIQLQLPLGE
jgi:hypothetical protein